MKLPRYRIEPWRPSSESPWQVPRSASWFPGLVDGIGGMYVRWVLGLRGLKLRQTSELTEALLGTRLHDDRLILVFRHCGDADPESLWYALNTLARREYRTVVPGPRPRFHFLASAEIALWGGPIAQWALRWAGAVPLAHGVGSRPALEYLRKHFETSPDPIVLAPEGQISYELHGPLLLDPGAASLAVWAAEAAPGFARVLPVGLRYRCPRETWARWSRFMKVLEEGIGLSRWEGADRPETDAAARIGRVWDHLLDRAEAYYRTIHRRSLDPLASRQGRCERLSRLALELAASVRGVTVESPRATVFRLRSSALDVVFRRRRATDRLEQAMNTRAAAEAWWVNRHQELVDVLQYLTPEGLPSRPDLERAVEAALNLADVAGRLAGGHIGHRPRFFRRTLEITFGEAWTVDRAPGQPSRTRTSEITERIRRSFDQLRSS